MDAVLFNLVDQHTPKMNDLVADGWAVHEMRHVEQHVDRIFRTAAEDFPLELKYHGYARCTPYEEFNEITKKQNNQTAYELAPSDLYLVKYMFSFAGEPLEPRFIYLPYCGDAGTIRIRGSEFAIAPVLADKAISIGTDHIFIPLNRDKLKFERTTQNFKANGQDQTAFVVWSEIYHRKATAKTLANKSGVRGKTTLGHYLFAKYGLKQTFAMFVDAQIEIGSEETMTNKTHPADKWVVCASQQIKPARDVKDRMYVSSNLRIAVPADRYNLVTASLVGALFYIVDRFPQRVMPEYIGEKGEERMWKTLMGQLLWGNTSHEGKLVDDIEAHLRSLDSYLDNESKAYLRDDGIYCDDLYQLLMYIIENFSAKVTKASGTVASMYEKRMMVRRYVLKDLTAAINTFMFKVNAFKPRTRPLTKNDVVQIMRHTLKMAVVTQMNRGHGEISSVAVPGDNKYFKITSRVVPQVDSSGAKAKSKATSSDPAKLLHSSIAEVGSYSTMSKSEPTGRDKINPHVQLSADGLILRDPDKVDLLDSVQRMIQR